MHDPTHAMHGTNHRTGRAGGVGGAGGSITPDAIIPKLRALAKDKKIEGESSGVIRWLR
jgi:hypothetical protein